MEDRKLLAIPHITVLIPVFNEEEIVRESVYRVHEYLTQRGHLHEVVVVNNGSTDRTAEIAREICASEPWFRYLEIPGRGVGRAFAHGISEARGDYVISLDADLSFDLRFVDYAVDLLRYAEMVVGSKTMGRQRRSLLRVIASQLYILCAQLFFNLTVSDYSIGCKAYRRDAIAPIVAHLDPWTGYVFELCLYLELHGKRVIQIGVDCDDRRTSHFSLLHEGVFRYRHLYRCWRRLARGDSWFAPSKSSSK